MLHFRTTLLVWAMLIGGFPRVATAEPMEKGLHLAAGLGVDFSFYKAELLQFEGGAGLNLKTDLIYFWNPNWAIDATSSVKLNRSEDFYLWDTLLTIGLRYHFTELQNPKWHSTYIKLFAGIAPTVVSLRKPGISDRLQYEGAVGGLTWGIFLPDDDKSHWFFEVTGAVQHLKRRKSLTDINEIPVVTEQRILQDGSLVSSLNIVIGAFVF